MAKNEPTASIYEDAPVPESTRSGAENPHAAKVAELEKLRSQGTTKAAAFTVPASVADGDVTAVEVHQKALARQARLLQEAGTALGISVRKTIKSESPSGPSRVTFWPVDKITRKPKPADAAPVEAPATA